MANSPRLEPVPTPKRPLTIYHWEAYDNKGFEISSGTIVVSTREALARYLDTLFLDEDVDLVKLKTEELN